MRWSIRLGVKPNSASRWGWRNENEGQTPLTAAAQFGRVEAIRFLLSKGADVNLRDFGGEGQTPLSTAAMQGQLEVCRVLLDAGADPNIPTEPRLVGETRNWTALDWAIRGKHTAVVALLRERGATESRRTPPQ
jgi:ankyrin repeat protein